MLLDPAKTCCSATSAFCHACEICCAWCHAVCVQARERARMMAAAKRSKALAAQRVAAGLVVAQV